MQAVATWFSRATLRPARRSASVRVGCRKDWSIILDIWERVTVMVFGDMLMSVCEMIILGENSVVILLLEI